MDDRFIMRTQDGGVSFDILMPMATTLTLCAQLGKRVFQCSLQLL